jgi:hypothetical protein
MNKNASFLSLSFSLSLSLIKLNVNYSLAHFLSWAFFVHTNLVFNNAVKLTLEETLFAILINSIFSLSYPFLKNEKKRDASGPNEIVACTSCGGGNSPCTHSANNGCATEVLIEIHSDEHSKAAAITLMAISPSSSLSDVLCSSEKKGTATSDSSCKDHRRNCEVNHLSLLSP